MPVDGRDHEWRDAVAEAALIDVGAGFEQRLGRLDVALARGDVQWRQAAPVGDQFGVVVLTADAGNLRCRRRTAAARRRRATGAAGAVAAVVAAAALRQQLLLLFLGKSSEIHFVGGQLRISAGGGEDPDRLGAAGRRGEIERGLALDLLPRVHVGTVVRQDSHRVGVAGGRGQHQRRRAVGGGAIRIGAVLDQRLDHFGVAGLGRYQQRRIAADPGRRFDVGAGVHQQISHLDVVAHRRPVQRRHAVALSRVDIAAVLQRGAERVTIARLRRFDDGGRRSGASGVDQCRQRGQSGEKAERAGRFREGSSHGR